MTGQWFRFYVEVLDDPKVQCLPPKTFKNWVNILCLAKQGNGTLPPLPGVAFALRLPEQETKQLIKTLQEADLLEQGGTDLKPHNWSGRQYMNDVSTERVKRFRKRLMGNVSETSEATPPDTDSETDTESSLRSDSAEPQNAEQTFPPVPFEMLRPMDYQRALFDLGLPWLAEKSGRQAAGLRSMLGKWLKLTGGDAQFIFERMQRAESLGIGEPVSWIERALTPKQRTPLEAAQQRGKDLEAAGHG